MRVLIDADGCPVTDIALQLCRQYGIRCILFCDTAHQFARSDAEIIVVDKGADSVDFAIANRVQPGDIVITQDYGLASMCLGRGARALHQDGWEYTLYNIDALLLARHESRKLRASGARMRGPKKRTAAQDAAFAEALSKLFHKAVQG